MPCRRGSRLQGSTASPEMFRKGRADFMQVWSDWCEQMLRSSAFLDMQKQCMGGNLAVRKQIRANLRRMQRDLQIAGREDIDALVAAVRRSQRRVLDQLEETSERLQALEAKLDCLSEAVGAVPRTGPRRAQGNGGKQWREEEAARSKRLTTQKAGFAAADTMMFNGNNPWLETQKAVLDEWTANARRVAALPRVVAQAQRVKKGATPSEVVYEEDHVKLLHYPGNGQVKHETPLVFVFALVNRPYILDILPNKSVVSHFVKAGFDTYLIDWGTATDADRYLTLDDYFERLPAQRRAAGPRADRAPKKSACWVTAWAAR